MKHQHKQMEIIILPSSNGIIKVHIYGFQHYGAWGQVFAELNGTIATAKGYHRKKVVIRALTKLHESLLNQD